PQKEFDYRLMFADFESYSCFQQNPARRQWQIKLTGVWRDPCRPFERFGECNLRKRHSWPSIMPPRRESTPLHTLTLHFDLGFFKTERPPCISNVRIGEMRDTVVRKTPALYRFSNMFGYAAATWKKCHLRDYGYVLALVSPFRGTDVDAVCFLPADVHSASLIGDDRHVWISDRILLVFGLKDRNVWCDDATE
ncbi:MAG: hypothetical protein IKJ45_03745, partial [Kiritimatiellae bacterium]|nr:hypothetical protein [Kiritimatiellia bacterium]